MPKTPNTTADSGPHLGRLGHDALTVLGAVLTDPDGRAFARLVTLAVLADLLLTLACLLAIVWGQGLPSALAVLVILS